MFERQTADLLLRSKLPCLGCHQLNGPGGRIGPDLSGLASRRPPTYVYDMIRDPQGTAPGTSMPRVPMSQRWLEVIASFLLQPGATPGGPVPDAPRVRPQPGPPIPDDGGALYGRFCAGCHGAHGAGDGFNAAFLPVRPTAHASKAYMSTRSDDALFDAIFAGGYVMNRSNFMPPFGNTLSREQIRTLVGYLRSLCRCEGPGWSRDQRCRRPLVV